MAFFLPMIAKAAAAAGKVAKVAGGAAKVAGGAAKVAGGAAKTALIGSKGKFVTQAGGKFGGIVGKKAGLLQKAGGFVKGATKQTLFGDAAKNAKISKSVAAGRKTTKVIRGLKAAGGGAPSIIAPPPSEEESPVKPGQTVFKTRRIGGNPLHYDTHTKKVGKSPEPKRTVLQKPGANPAEGKSKITKKISSPKAKAGVTQVSLTKRKLSTERNIGKNASKKRIDPPVKIPEGSALDRMSSKYTPEQMQQFADERGIDTQGAFSQAGQISDPNQGQGIPSPEGTQGLEGAQGPPGEGPIESRDVKEPFWSKAVSGLGKVAFAGAPGPIREVVEGALPSSRYAAKQAKVEESRDLLFKMSDKLDSPKEIQNFLKNPDAVEAFTNRVSGLNDKDDVAEFLSFAMDNDDVKPSELIGQQGFSSEPSEGSVPVQMGGQTIHLRPPSRVIPGGSSLYNEAQGKVEFGTERAREFDAFKAAMKEEDPDVTNLEAIIAHSALDKGRYVTSVVGNKLVKTDKFTGEQTVIKSDRNKTSIRTVPIPDEVTGKVIGVMFYNANTLDPETGEPQIFDKVYFKDMVKEDGSQFTEEEINAPWFPKFITDLWYGVTGKEKTKAKSKKQNTVNKYIDGGA